MLNYPYSERAKIPQTIEQNTRTIAWATVLVRKLIAENTERNIEDIPIGASIYCARECCSDGDGYKQNDQIEIIRNAHLIAKTSGLAQKVLAEALGCNTEEIPIKQTINLSLEAIWDYEQRETNKFRSEQTEKLIDILSDAF
jgi:hypothetical protein